MSSTLPVSPVISEQQSTFNNTCSGDAPIRLLLALGVPLGWKTFANRVKNVVSTRTDIQPDFVYLDPRELNFALRKLCHVTTFGKTRRFFVHPIVRNRYWVQQVAQRGRFTSTYDGVFIAPHSFAHAFLSVFDSNVPLFVSLDVTMPQNLRTLGSWFYHSKALEYERDILQRADHIFPLTNWIANSVRKDYCVPPSRVSVIKPGTLIKEAVRIHGPSQDMPTIGFVGNPFDRKGGNDLLSVHQEYLADISRLHIVSRDFECSSSLNNVTHDREIPNDQLLGQVMPSWDIFCLPTHFDMAGFVFAEAAGCGLPSVGTSVGGVPEYCVDNVTGFLVEPRSKTQLAARLRQLILDQPLRRSLGESARKYAVRHFDVCEQIGNMFDAIVLDIKSRRAGF